MPGTVLRACSHCRERILFGGRLVAGQAFCSTKCLAAGRVDVLADRVSDDDVRTAVRERHRSHCRICGGEGPIDVRIGHRVASPLVASIVTPRPHEGCERCQRRGVWGDLLYTLVFGWWSGPGLYSAPTAIAQNMRALMREHDRFEPSPELAQLVRRELAEERLAYDPHAEEVTDAGVARSHRVIA